MAAPRPRNGAHADEHPASAAVRFLAERGYDAVTAGELADAIGMSRSTFFRRFGSKDDVVFADHDLALRQLEEVLEAGGRDVPDALTRATAGVLQILTRDPATAKLRSDLLRHTPALRERELVITHRYERVIEAYLSRVAGPETPRWVPIALAAGVVAVHNSTLRRWLRETDPRLLGALDQDLRQLADRFAPWFGGGERGGGRVVVAAFEADATPEEVLRAVTAFRAGSER